MDIASHRRPLLAFRRTNYTSGGGVAAAWAPTTASQGRPSPRLSEDGEDGRSQYDGPQQQEACLKNLHVVVILISNPRSMVAQTG